MYDLSLHQVNRNAIAVRSIQRGFKFGELIRCLKTSCDAHGDWANSRFPLLLSIVHRWLLRFGTFIKNPLKNRKIANTSKKPFRKVVSPFIQIGIYLAMKGVGKNSSWRDGGYSRGQEKYFLSAKAAWKRLYPVRVTQLSWRALCVKNRVIIFSWYFLGHIT